VQIVEVIDRGIDVFFAHHSSQQWPWGRAARTPKGKPATRPWGRRGLRTKFLACGRGILVNFKIVCGVCLKAKWGAFLWPSNARECVK
jgi:hypothetical protein